MSSIARIGMCLTLAWLAATPAAAQEKKYAVEFRRTSVVGDAIRRTRRSESREQQKVKREGKVVQDQTTRRGFECVQTDEVTAVEGEEFAGGRRVYERWLDLEKKTEADVKGLVIEHARAADRTFSWSRTAGPEVPEFLKKDLDAEVKRLTKFGQDRAAGKDVSDPLLPTQPMAVGERWVVPLERACESLGFPFSAVDPAQSRVSGVLEQVEVDGEWRRVKIGGVLVLTTLFGRKCEPPGKVTIEISIRARPGDIEATYATRGTLRGSYVDGPTGNLIQIDTSWEQTDQRVVIEPPSKQAPARQGE